MWAEGELEDGSSGVGGVSGVRREVEQDKWEGRWGFYVLIDRGVDDVWDASQHISPHILYNKTLLLYYYYIGREFKWKIFAGMNESPKKIDTRGFLNIKTFLRGFDVIERHHVSRFGGRGSDRTMGV